MAIVITKMWSTQGGSISNKDRTATEGWQVIGTQKRGEALAKAASIGVQVGFAHPDDPLLRISSVSAERTGFDMWTVKAVYSIKANGAGPGTYENPLDAPATYAWDIGLISEEIDRDIDKNPILNSSQEALSGNHGEFYSISLTVTRNEKQFDMGKALRFTGAVNRDGFTVAGLNIDAGQCKCRAIKPVGAYTLAAEYLTVTYSFEFRRDGFRLRTKDVGTRVLIKADPAAAAGEPLRKLPVFFEDSNGNPGDEVTEPQPLNGRGGMFYNRYLQKSGTIRPFNLQDANPPKGAEVETTEDAVWLKWKICPEENFNELGLK